MVGLSPAIFFGIVAGVARAGRKREPEILGIVAVLGGVLAFEVAFYALGKILPWERFFITALPITVLCLATLARPLPKSTAEHRDELAVAFGQSRPYLDARRRQRLVGAVVLAIVAIAAVSPSPFTTWHTMWRSTFGSEDREEMAPLVKPKFGITPRQTFGAGYFGSIKLVDYLDSLKIPRGGLMVDNFDGCVPDLILESRNPNQFTIPNDVNWLDLFGAPYQHGIRYMIVERPGGLGNLDQLNREYPSLYADGGGFATLQRSVHLSGCGDLRVYRLLPGVTPPGE
jgi:hypothetical protein